MIDLFQELQRRRLAHELTDPELLERFRNGRDAAAFETLLRRHGPMVLGVCRRLLRDQAAVDDAFQATFLVLLRQADSVRKLASVGSWLHGVALRTAQHAITLAARRRRHEDAYARLVPESAAPPEPTAEIGPWLDEELRRLPEGLRRPLVLCYLEGLTKTQAARRLGLPEGTVSSRLTRARAALRVRLLRRGFAAAVVLAALDAKPVLAEVSPALAKATLNLAQASLGGAAATAVLTSSAATLGDHVMHSFAIAKLKFTTLCATLVLATGTAGVAAFGGWGQPDKPAATGVLVAAAAGSPAGALSGPQAPAPTRLKPGVAGAEALAPAIDPRLKSEYAERAPTAQQTRETLRRVTEKFANGLDPMPLEEHLNFIGKSFGVTFIIDNRAFLQQNADAEMGKKEVQLPKTPHVKLETVLRTLVHQVEGAAFVVKSDHILITTEEKVKGEAMLQENISFEAREGQTLEQALKELADEHGVTILLDVRCEEQGRTVIRGHMQNVSLQVAVRLLAEMGGLKAVTVGNAMFVTDATNAFTMQQEEGGQVMPPAALGGGIGGGLGNPIGGGAGFGGVGILGGGPASPYQETKPKAKKNKGGAAPAGDPLMPPATPNLPPQTTAPAKPAKN